MKKINKWLIIVALVINQLNWPVAALAQTVTDTPSNTPTDQPTPPPATNTPVPTITNVPTPSSNPSPTTDPASPTPTTSNTITPTPDPSGTTSPTPSIDPSLSPIPSIIPTISPIPTGTITGVDPVAPQTIIVVTNNNAPNPNNNSSSNSGNNSNNDPNITNNGSSNTNAAANSQTGGNQVSTPDASHRSTDTINTGDATAYGNLINMVNTNNINSSVKVYLVNSLDGSVNQIDLNSMWQLLASGQPTNLVTVDASNDPNNQININNNGNIQNQLAVNANTGNNQITTNGKASIATGNAYALANVINMLNSTFVNSKIFIGVLNLNGSTLGDLILPGPQNFAPTGSAITGSNIAIGNQATIGNGVATTADTGNNSTSNTRGNTLVNTGNATSLSNVMNDSNMNLINAASLILALNALGNWSGNVYNWGAPGSVISGSNFSNLFSTGAMPGDGNGNNNSFMIAINNQANIYNQVAVSALTGGNSIQSYGSSVINTGNAWAVANIANLANLNAIGSNYFYGVVNIVGDWKGNVIFAYPDLALSMGMSKNEVHNGDSVTAMIDYNNIGYDQASGVRIEMDLPDGVSYQGDNSGVTPTNNGHSIVWNLGNEEAKQDKKFDVNLKVDESGTVTASLIKPVMAADNSLTISANVSTLKTEVTTDNNNASGQIQVVDNNSTASNDSGTTLWPNLKMTVKNNVNDFVYPGDVVTFEINGKNEGDAEAYGTYIHQVLMDGDGKVLADMDVNIGDVPVDHAGKVTFGMPLNYQFTKDQIVTSNTTWIGHTEQGDNTQSGTAITTFQVKTHHSFHITGPVTPVQAVNIDPNILGAATSQAIKLGNLDILPYLLLFVASMIWLISKVRTNTFYKKNWLKITGSILIILFMFGCFLYSGLTLYKNSQAVVTFVKTIKI